MTSRLLSCEFGVEAPLANSVSVPDFCKDTCFNFFSASTGVGEIIKKRFDTRVVVIRDAAEIFSLSVRSSFVNYWSDLWVNEEGYIIDPLIKNLSLESNFLPEFTITEERRALRFLNLSNNPDLTTIYLPLCKRLEVIKLNKLNNLQSVLLATDSLAIARLELRQSTIYPGLISSFNLNGSLQGIIDATNATSIELSDEDREALEFLQFSGWDIRGISF